MASGSQTLINDSGINQLIGKRSDYGNYGGLIDDVRIYNRALSATEVAQLYNSTKDGYLGKVKASTGLVGYWKLDDNTSTATVIDYSGKNNNGVFYDSGSATSTSLHSTTTAVVARAMVFDGVNDYVDVGNGASLRVTNAFTYSAWIKWSTTPTGYGGIWWDQNGPTYNRILIVGSSKSLLAQYTVLGSAATPANSIPPNIWKHVVLTYNGSELVFWINGIKQTPTITSGSVPANSNNRLIGVGFPDYYYFNGLIDEVRIYNRALSAEEIKQLYERGRNGLP